MTAIIANKWQDLTRWIIPRSGAVGMDTVDRINEIADSLKSSSDANLKSLAERLRRTITTPAQLDEPETLEMGFALAVDAIRRTLGLRLYDVQLLGGLIMAHGRISEMQTGEGKTLTVAPVAFVHSLAGDGVHVATTNAYLAERDYEELREPFKMIGASIGLLDESGNFEKSAHAYQQDITYGTGYQYGFDYLRDQLALSAAPQAELGQQVIRTLSGRSRSVVPRLQRSLGVAIVDEIDSVLIDEAGTPLVLSGQQDRSETAQAFRHADQVAGQLQDGTDFQISTTGRRIEIYTPGYEKINRAQHAGLQLSRPWITYVRNALFARHCLQADVDYVVSDGQVRIVDQNTGRIFDDRSWRDGLHQAVETFEGVEMSESKSSLARVTRQRYFQRYRRLCGLTGTAAGNEAEFGKFYGLNVQVVPPRKESLRKVLPTRFFAKKGPKLNAVVEEAAHHHRKGQPILIATRTITLSKEVSILLAKKRLPHVLLNGVQDENESSIISRAGRAGAITVATNMAGRGTDIKISREGLRAGGLHVIGAEQNFSPRVDRQLIGRSARQGDPGSCRFYVSAEDDLIVEAGSRLATRMTRDAEQTSECKTDFTSDVRALHKRIEQEGFEKRKDMVRRDLWLDSVLETLNKEA